MTKAYQEPRRRKPLKWIGIDTEGANHPDGYQYTHVLSANGPGYQRAPLVSRNKPLSTKRMLHWISNLPRGYKLVGYFFKYDQNMILWELPEEKLRILFGVESLDGDEQLRIVEYEGYWISRFSTLLEVMRPRNPNQDLPTTRQELKSIPAYFRKEIWDAGKFFQTSFLSACEKWNIGTDKERRLLKKWKEQRNAFTLEFFQANVAQIVNYTMLENDLLCQLFKALNDVCDENGYLLKSWYSPGSIAKVMLKQHGVRDHLEAMPAKSADFWNACDWAYFGGWFEIPEPGRIDVPLWEYDINSAYPYAMLSLPCLVHGEWIHGSAAEESKHDLFYVEWKPKKEGDFTYGPFPVRDKKGVVIHPLSFHGWYWGYEVLAAKQALPQFEYTTKDRWRYVSDCSCRPFDWVRTEYKRRQQIGKDVKGIAIKLGLNSLYGSIASPLSPAYCNGIWAGMITSMTRAMLLDALSKTTSKNVVMFATDAIVTKEPLALDCGEDLGQWEATEILPGSLIIQPGVYIFPEEDKMKIKTRGVSLDWVKKHKNKFYRAWDKHGEKARVKVNGSRMQFIGWGQAFNRNKPELARTWVPAEKEIDFGTPKRFHGQAAEVWPGHERPHGKFGNVKMLESEQEKVAFEQALVSGEQPRPESSLDLE